MVPNHVDLSVQTHNVMVTKYAIGEQGNGNTFSLQATSLGKTQSST